MTTKGSKHGLVSDPIFRMTVQVYAAGAIFGSTAHPKASRAKAATAIGALAGGIGHTAMWPWVFKVVGHRMDRKGGIPSAVNHDTWASEALAKHQDYSAAGVIQLAQKILREAVADEDPSVKALIASMPEGLLVPEHTRTPPRDPEHPPETDRATNTEDAGKGKEQAGGPGHDKDQGAASDRQRRKTKDAADYTDLGGPSGKGETSRKRPSTFANT